MTINDMKKAIENGEVDPLSEKEKQTITSIVQGDNKKNVEELSVEELNTLLNDCKDTLNYVQNNRSKFGEMYDFALNTVYSLESQAKKELDKRK